MDRNQERAAIAARRRQLNEAAKNVRIADREGVINVDFIGRGNK